MHAPLPPHLAATLDQFAHANGMSTAQLVNIAAHALAVHLAATGLLILPLRIQPQQEPQNCITCHHNQHMRRGENILTMSRG